MAARSRPRGGQIKDEFDEERSLWNQIKSDGRSIDQLMAQSETIRKKILDLEAEQNARLARGAQFSERIDEAMETSLREIIKLDNEILGLVKSSDGDNDICTQITLLSALRSSEDTPTSASRATSVGKSQRDRPGKQRKVTDSIDDRDSIAADSPGPSPKVVISQKDKLIAKSASSRAGSVPVGREGSVKAEDDDNGKDQPPRRLSPNTEVLYRNSKQRVNQEGEGILCRVTSVIGDGKQRRYEIIDADPDPPTPSQPYRASVAHLVPIPSPSANTTLPDLPKKRGVLALYPGTTTFYKAEVVANWVAERVKKEKDDKDASVDGKENLVRLRFEGEDEADREMSVERRYVLNDK
jgi:SAGA-associated factor 29